MVIFKSYVKLPEGLHLPVPRDPQVAPLEDSRFVGVRDGR